MRHRLILAASACALLVTALPAVAQNYNNPPPSNPQPSPGRALNDGGPMPAYNSTENTRQPAGTAEQRTRRTARTNENRTGGQPNGFVQGDNRYAQGGFFAPGGYPNSYGYGNSGYYNYSPGWGGGYGGGYVGVSAPDPNAIAWCQANFRSFDPATGTYLGFDGQRHPCP